jgi:hypothetical protein
VCKNQAGAAGFSPIPAFPPQTENFSHPYFHAAAGTERFGSARPGNLRDKAPKHFNYPIEKQKARDCRKNIDNPGSRLYTNHLRARGLPAAWMRAP